MKYEIIATCELSGRVRVVATYAKEVTAEKNLIMLIKKGSWFGETFSKRVAT